MSPRRRRFFFIRELNEFLEFILDTYGVRLVRLALVSVPVIIFLLYLLVRWSRAKLKERRLNKKYKDPDLVKRLMNQECWEGQTKELLLDALGKPQHIDPDVDQPKYKETWKYRKFARRRYHLGVKLAFGEVVGWERFSD